MSPEMVCRIDIMVNEFEADRGKDKGIWNRVSFVASIGKLVVIMRGKLVAESTVY
jgi:hypothetical protein